MFAEYVGAISPWGEEMNYSDWVNTFKNRTPEQLRELINAINVLEKDVDINREFDDAGLFAGSSGCSIRGAAKEALDEAIS